ncbi:MAG: MFS transporter [Anaerolineales bacterium]|nr:MFS transporter [Anaerolineales bacterium]
MSKEIKRLIWITTAGAFYSFFVFGFSDNLKGATLPAMRAELSISFTQAGTILMGLYIGFVAAVFLTGFLAEAAGKKSVILLAGVSLVLGVGGYSVFATIELLFVSMFMLGFGLGAIELGANAIIVELHPKDTGRYLNLMSVFHGLGSMLAPLITGWLLGAGHSWRSVYRWDYVLVILMILGFSLLRYPSLQAAEKRKLDLRRLFRTAFTAPLLLLYSAITLYVAIEIGMASWIPQFLQTVHAQPEEQSAQALALFFGLVMAGRFIGSFLVDRIGHLKSILFASLAASVCVALGLFGPDALVFFLPAAGFFLSIIFPTITAAVSDLYGESSSAVLGILFTFAGIGGMIGPWLVGFNSDLFGMKLGFATNLVYGLLTAVSVLVVMGLTAHQRVVER